MSVARKEMAGYSMVDADNLRRAMGKKIKSVMKAEEEKFVAGSVAQGHEEKVGRESSGSSSTSRATASTNLIRADTASLHIRPHS